MNFYDYYIGVKFYIESSWFRVWHSCTNWISLSTIGTNYNKKDKSNFNYTQSGMTVFFFGKRIIKDNYIFQLVDIIKYLSFNQANFFFNEYSLKNLFLDYYLFLNDM